MLRMWASGGSILPAHKPHKWVSSGCASTAEIRATLSHLRLSGINSLYQKKRGNRPFDPKWYELLDHKSIWQIAKVLKQGTAYELWYNGGSQVIHAQSPTQHWSVQGDFAALKAVRHLEDAHAVKGGVGFIALRAYRLVIERYLPNEVQSFQQKYLSDWRKPFRSEVKVQYEFSGLTAETSSEMGG